MESSTPPVPPVPAGGGYSADHDHLRLLAIFQFTLGGLTCLFALFPIMHLIMGLMMINNPEMMSHPGHPGPPPPPVQFMGYFFVGMALLFIIIGELIGLAMIWCGFNLLKRRNYMASMVIASIECIMIPLGTVLGVFTIIVLNRLSVRQLFGQPV